MTKDEEILQKVIQERGYLVVWCHTPRKVGQDCGKCQWGNNAPLNTAARFQVTGETDRKDAEDQEVFAIRLGLEVLGFPEGALFYRVSTD